MVALYVALLWTVREMYKEIKLDDCNKMSLSMEEWIAYSFEVARKQAVEEFINRLKKVSGPIYYSELKKIAEEMGYKC